MTFGDLNLRRAIGALALGAALVAAAACGSSYNGTTGPSSGGTGTTGVPATTADVTITINGMAGDKSYTPSPATVKMGQTVSWHNGDSIAHTATGSGFDTGAIAAGGTSAPITFTTAGTLGYHCTFHPDMVGSLTVSQ